jgi:uncharacterized lipoprotein YajG
MNFNLKNIFTAASLAALATLSGCAVIPSTADLNYQAQKNVAHVQNAGAVNVVVTGGQADRVLGHLKSGFFTGAAVMISKTVDATTANSLSDELKNRGFEIGHGAMVSVNIKNYSCKIDSGFAAAHYLCDFSATVAAPDYLKIISGHGDTVSYMSTALASDMRKSMSLALSDATANLFADPAFIAAISTK